MVLTWLVCAQAALLSSASSAVVPYASLAGNSFLKRLSVFSGQTGLPFTSHSSYESLIQVCIHLSVCSCAHAVCGELDDDMLGVLLHSLSHQRRCS